MELLFGSTVILDERSGLMASTGFDLPVSLQVDPAALSGADVDPWPRGGGSCQLNGSVTRQFDTHAEAVAWYTTHPTAITALGRQTLSWQVDGTTIATAPAVPQQVVARRPEGVSVTCDYSFLCAPPAAA